MNLPFTDRRGIANTIEASLNCRYRVKPHVIDLLYINPYRGSGSIQRIPRRFNARA